MSKQKFPKAQIGEEPTIEESFYIQWGQELLRNNLSFINSVLRQLVSLNSAFLAGSLLLLDEKTVGTNLVKTVDILLFLSLFISFLGIMPYSAKIDLRKPEEVKRFYENSLRWKSTCTWLSGILLTAGIGIVLSSFIIR